MLAPVLLYFKGGMGMINYGWNRDNFCQYMNTLIQQTCCGGWTHDVSQCQDAPSNIELCPCCKCGTYVDRKLMAYVSGKGPMCKDCQS